MQLSLRSVAVIAGLVTGSSLVHAQSGDGDVKWKVKGKFRGDALQYSKTSKTGDADSVTSKSSEITLKRAQMEFVGTKGPVDLHIKYYAEANYLKNAFVEYNFSPSCSMSFGKFDVRDMSLEWDYSTTDQYIFSTPASTKPIDNTISNAPGVELKGLFGDHGLYLQVIQGAKPANTTFNSTGGLTSTIQYRGSFADKMIRPIATYAMVRTQGNKGTTSGGTALNYGNGYQNRFGLGVKFVVAGSTTDVEYDQVKYIKQKDVDTSKDETLGAFVFQTRLPAFSDVTPYLKVVLDTDKKGADQNAGDVARTAVAAGAEYAWDTQVRVHAIYIMDSSKTTKGAFDKTTNTVKVGADDTKETMNAFNFGVTASI